jgi:hypothetical protein
MQDNGMATVKDRGAGFEGQQGFVAHITLHSAASPGSHNNGSDVRVDLRPNHTVPPSVGIRNPEQNLAVTGWYAYSMFHGYCPPSERSGSTRPIHHRLSSPILAGL